MLPVLLTVLEGASTTMRSDVLTDEILLARHNSETVCQKVLAGVTRLFTLVLRPPQIGYIYTPFVIHTVPDLYFNLCRATLELHIFGLVIS
jgi:hypothetical protein